MTGFACWYLGVLVHVYLISQTWGRSGAWCVLLLVSLGLWFFVGMFRVLYLAASRAGMVTGRRPNPKQRGVTFGKEETETE